MCTSICVPVDPSSADFPGPSIWDSRSSSPAPIPVLFSAYYSATSRPVRISVSTRGNSRPRASLDLGWWPGKLYTLYWSSSIEITIYSGVPWKYTRSTLAASHFEYYMAACGTLIGPRGVGSVRIRIPWSWHGCCKSNSDCKATAPNPI